MADEVSPLSSSSTATRSSGWPTRSSRGSARGERPSIDEYARKYPELADEIRELLPALVELEREPVDGRHGDGTVGDPSPRAVGRRAPRGNSAIT